MAKYTMHYDMVVSGSVQIEAENDEEALQKCYDILNADDIEAMVDGLAMETAGYFDGTARLIVDETGIDIY